jgi:hypothetical protein
VRSVCVCEFIVEQRNKFAALYKKTDIPNSIWEDSNAEEIEAL